MENLIQQTLRKTASTEIVKNESKEFLELWKTDFHGICGKRGKLNITEFLESNFTDFFYKMWKTKFHKIAKCEKIEKLKK